jgi:hypothetical protein
LFNGFMVYCAPCLFNGFMVPPLRSALPVARDKDRRENGEGGVGASKLRATLLISRPQIEIAASLAND